PGRHAAVARAAHRLLDVGDRATMEPYRIAQVRRAQGRVAFAVRTVTRGARLEHRLAERRLDRIARRARQARDVVRDIGDVRARQDRAERLHDTFASIEDARHDGLWRAAIEP